jgi:hypothetical protein
MKPVFSILHASLGRPEKAFAAMIDWIAKSNYPDLVEYIFALNADDPTAHELINKLVPGRLLGERVHVVQDQFSGSAAAWDAAAKIAKGDLLIQAQDDVEPPGLWASGLMDVLLKEVGGNWRNEPVVIRVSDGYRQDGLMCTAIMTMARVRQEGHFIFPGYLSVFSDDEVTFRAMRDSRMGICKLIDARDLVFRHRHHYHDKSVPFDATYSKENSAEAYIHGEKLFFARNPEARTDGIITWH